MEKPNNNNYICARWRDAENDPPPHGWIGLNVMASGACYYGACGYMPGDQWLDVTDIPPSRVRRCRQRWMRLRRNEGGWRPYLSGGLTHLSQVWPSKHAII